MLNSGFITDCEKEILKYCDIKALTTLTRVNSKYLTYCNELIGEEMRHNVIEHMQRILGIHYNRIMWLISNLNCYIYDYYPFLMRGQCMKTIHLNILDCGNDLIYLESQMIGRGCYIENNTDPQNTLVTVNNNKIFISSQIRIGYRLGFAVSIENEKIFYVPYIYKL